MNHRLRPTFLVVASIFGFQSPAAAAEPVPAIETVIEIRKCSSAFADALREQIALDLAAHELDKRGMFAVVTCGTSKELSEVRLVDEPTGRSEVHNFSVADVSARTLAVQMVEWWLAFDEREALRTSHTESPPNRAEAHTSATSPTLARTMFVDIFARASFSLVSKTLAWGPGFLTVFDLTPRFGLGADGWLHFASSASTDAIGYGVGPHLSWIVGKGFQATGGARLGTEVDTFDTEVSVTTFVVQPYVGFGHQLSLLPWLHMSTHFEIAYALRGGAASASGVALGGRWGLGVEF